MTQSIEEQIGPIPAIEPELHLFKIGGEMLGANPVPRSHDSAFKKRESRLYRIGMDVPHDVYAGTMVNLFVVLSVGFPHGGIVRGCVIGENDFHILRDVLADVLCERSAFGVTGMEEAEIAIALADADDYFLVVVLCDMALAAIHAADVSNVHLDFAIQHRFIGLRHSMADAMAEIPCGLVAADSERALNLAGRHALLRLTEKKSRQKPLSQRQVRIVKDGASGHAKLIAAIGAFKLALREQARDCFALAAWAGDTFRPAQAYQLFAAFIFRGVSRIHIYEVH